MESVPERGVNRDLNPCPKNDHNNKDHRKANETIDCVIGKTWGKTSCRSTKFSCRTRKKANGSKNGKERETRNINERSRCIDEMKSEIKRLKEKEEERVDGNIVLESFQTLKKMKWQRESVGREKNFLEAKTRSRERVLFEHCPTTSGHSNPQKKRKAKNKNAIITLSSSRAKPIMKSLDESWKKVADFAHKIQEEEEEENLQSVRPLKGIFKRPQTTFPLQIPKKKKRHIT
ncbi:hypothetical protein SK128_009564 [Halocaridina rubra]|uniref:Uncharacterized protein n=1 Tax=Halocaridina rubra TaxID=373956 RepID=A0AAN8ZZE8_HALRR